MEGVIGIGFCRLAIHSNFQLIDYLRINNLLAVSQP